MSLKHGTSQVFKHRHMAKPCSVCARSATYTSSVPSVVKNGGCVASLCFDMAA